ncbi:MAG TPA: peptidoglycan-binding domain-containing protein [Rhizobiaceae bacterium]|nr:peptidoglycan-binding domain-containing protein [Rhizobiaceae bacterium]
MPRSAKPVDDYEEFNPLREGASAIGAAIGRNPVAVGGTTAFLVAFFYVSANAVWYQPHFHNGAFFATRDVADLSKPAIDEPSETTIVIEREPEVETIPTPEVAPQPGDPIVERVQSILSDLDFYAGDVDGLIGPNTRTAIEAYRSKVGLPASGEIDDQLLDHLGARDTTSAVTPRPAPREVAIATPASAIENSDAADVTPAEKPAATEGDPLVMKVQAGLKAFGHEAMEIDGVLGSKTKAAIKEFQTLFGMPVTGEPNEALYAKMRKEGLVN